MNLSEARASALNTCFSSAHADALTYAGTSIYGHVTYGGNAPTARHATLTVRVSDVAAPAYRDTVVIGSTTWRVHSDGGEAIITGDGLTWEIPLIRDEKPRAF